MTRVSEQLVAARRLCAFAALVTLAFAWPSLGPVVALAVAVVAAPPSMLAYSRRWPWSWLTFAAVVAAGAVGWTWGPELAAGGLLTYLLVHWWCVARVPAEGRVSVALSLLMLVLVAARAPHGGAWVGVLVWMALLPLALGQGLRARWLLVHVALTTLLGVPLVALLADVHASIGPPRVFANTATGLDVDAARFGDLGELLHRRGEVLRVTFSPEPTEPIYLRGVAFDTWDGQQWTRDPSPGTLPVGMGGGDGPVHEVLLELFEPKAGVLPTAGTLQEASWEGGPLYIDPDGDLLLPGAHHLEYRFTARGPLGQGGEVLPDLGPDPRWLALPADRDPRLLDLANALAGTGGGEEERARRLAEGLRAYAIYTRTPRTAQGAPLPWFLFETREGHCEYFATALVLLAREVGLPARYVAGYQGGEHHADGGYWVFREEHAHAWAEIYLPNRGWRVFDATPQAVQPVATAVSPLRAQVDVLATPRGASRLTAPVRAAEGVEWGGLVSAAFFLIVVAVARRVLEGRGVVGWHARARRQLSALGWRVPPELPAVAAAEWVREHAAGEAADALVELAWLHHRVRFGGEDDEPLRRRAQDLARRVRGIGPPPLG